MAGALEVSAEMFTKLEPGAEEPRLHVRDRQSQRVRCLRDGKFLHIAQEEDDSVRVWERSKRLLQDFSKLGLAVELFRVCFPVGDPFH